MADVLGIPNVKVILLGNTSVGKTSIVLQFYKSTFLEESQPTIGAAYISKVMETKKGKINLNVWDTAGQERFKSIIPMYLRGSSVVIFVCSVSDEKSISDLPVWEDLLEKHREEKIIGVVVLNKIDILKEKGEEAEIPNYPKKFADEHDYSYFEVSAKEKINVMELFQKIAEDVAETTTFSVQQETEAKIAVKNENNSSCC